MQTMRVMMTSKIKHYSNRVKGNSIGNKVNGRKEMTNPGYNYNKWALLQQE